MEHADTAQLAALGGALGSVLVLLGRGRLPLLAGLVVLGAAELGLAWALGGGPLDRLSGASGAAAVALALVALGAATALFVKRPAIVPIAVLVAAPLRPPLSFDSSSTLLVQIADDGRLGRLLPLYFVLAAAAAALAWRALRGRELRPLPMQVALPAAAFFAFACCSLLWADDVEAATNLLLFFTLPFVALLATVARAELPALGAARPGHRRARARHPVRGGRALAGGHARAVLLRAEPRRVEREHGLLPRDLAVRRPEPLRPPRGARDRRGAHAARHAALASVAADRPGGRDVGGPAVLVLAVEHGRAARDHRRARRGDGRPARAPRGGSAHAGGRAGGLRLPGRAGGGREVLEQDHERPDQPGGGRRARDREAPRGGCGHRRAAACQPAAGRQPATDAELRVTHHSAHRVRRAGRDRPRALRVAAGGRGVG